MPRRVPPSLLVLLAVVAAGCGGDSSGPSPFELDGKWAGTASNNGVAINVVLNLADDGQTISGSGGISGSGPMCSLTVTGTRDGIRFSTQLKCDPFVPFLFNGKEVSGDRLEGTFSGSGVPSTHLALVRVQA